jgi:hypothetical protein
MLSLFLVFFGPVEHCNLENFGSPWHAVTAGVKTFWKKGKKSKFLSCEMDANLIRVAPECQDTAGLARSYCGTFGQWAYF